MLVLLSWVTDVVHTVHVYIVSTLPVSILCLCLNARVFFVSYFSMHREGLCCSLLLYNTYCITTGSVWVAPAIWRDATPAVTDSTHSVFVCLCMPFLLVFTLQLQIATAASAVVGFMGSCTWWSKGEVIECSVYTVCVAFAFQDWSSFILKLQTYYCNIYRGSSLYQCDFVLWGFDSWQQTVKTSLSVLAGAGVLLFHSWFWVSTEMDSNKQSRNPSSTNKQRHRHTYAHTH